MIVQAERRTIEIYFFIPKCNLSYQEIKNHKKYLQSCLAFLMF